MRTGIAPILRAGGRPPGKDNELRSQTLAWARGEAITPKYFLHQIAFNLIPHIDKFDDGGYTGEEMKLVHEVRKILETPDLAVSPTTVRVPVFTTHSIAVNAETEVAKILLEAK